MTVLITLTTAGADSGPFDLYSDIDGYISAFEIGVSKASMLSGYSSALVPNGTTNVRVKSTGVCVNYIDIILATTSTTTSTTSSPFYSEVTNLTASVSLDTTYFIGVNLSVSNLVTSNTTFEININTAGGTFLSTIIITAGNTFGSENIDTGSISDPSPISGYCFVSCTDPGIDLSSIGLCY